MIIENGKQQRITVLCGAEVLVRLRLNVLV